jgi:hypothetical protein
MPDTWMLPTSRWPAPLRLLVATILLAAARPVPAAAQASLDARVGPDAFGHPIVAGEVLLGHVVMTLSHAVGIPMGWEYGTVARRRIELTGLTLREALDTLARHTGCEWREMSGVIVCRPAAAWAQPATPLDTIVPPINLRQTSGNRALALVARLLGAPADAVTSFSDTRRFPLSTEQGRLVDLLNAIVRAHGDMVWLFEHRRRTETFPYIVSLIGGEVSGGGLGVSGSGLTSELDPSRFEVVDRPSASTDLVVSRVVGPAPDGRPVVVNGPYYWSVQQLAAATRTPFGFESAPPLAGVGRASIELPVTGRTLRDALDTIVALDPRYEWREMDGVIVVRPVAAWSDAGSALFALTPPVKLDDARTVEAVTAAAVALGRSPKDLVTFPDGRRLSLDVRGGTMLDLLNGIVRAHGEMYWTYTPADKEDTKRTGLSHTLMFGIFDGVGMGVLVR